MSFGNTVTKDTVFTVPASFNDVQRQATNNVIAPGFDKVKNGTKRYLLLQGVDFVVISCFAQLLGQAQGRVCWAQGMLQHCCYAGLQSCSSI